MELLIRRDQAGGLLGGVKFQLTARAQLTEDEAAAVNRYKMGDTILYEKPTEAPDRNSFMSLAKYRFMVPRIQVKDLVSGKTIEAKDILEIIDAEEQLKTAAEAFHKMLKAASTFGGETALKFDA
jgi:hypothetical protein